MKKRIAVLISNAGTGTNLQAIIDGIESGKINAEIAVVISDKEDALGLKRAEKHNICTYILAPKENLEKVLKETYKVDYIALAGWKKIIPDSFIDAFPYKILNIHPGLVPNTIDGVVLNPDGTQGLWNRGKFTDAAIQNFFDNKATYAGSTVHFLSKEFDFGTVLEHCFEKILPTDTVDSLYQRLKQKENEAYISVFTQICKV